MSAGTTRDREARMSRPAGPQLVRRGGASAPGAAAACAAVLAAFSCIAAAIAAAAVQQSRAQRRRGGSDGARGGGADRGGRSSRERSAAHPPWRHGVGAGGAAADDMRLVCVLSPAAVQLLVRRRPRRMHEQAHGPVGLDPLQARLLRRMDTHACVARRVSARPCGDAGRQSMQRCIRTDHVATHAD
eukprot:311633-Chlamydomonas_euryale.AAC.1